MKGLSRILDSLVNGPSKLHKSSLWESYSYWIIGSLGAFGICWIAAIGLIEPNRFTIVSLGVLSLLWLLLAVNNGSSWRRTLRSWERTLDGWKETSHLVGDVSNLLKEALDDLSTWDREKAEDIAHRADTVGMMRTQNIDSRMKEESGD